MFFSLGTVSVLWAPLVCSPLGPHKYGQQCLAGPWRVDVFHEPRLQKQRNSTLTYCQIKPFCLYILTLRLLILLNGLALL